MLKLRVYSPWWIPHLSTTLSVISLPFLKAVYTYVLPHYNINDLQVSSWLQSSQPRPSGDDKTTPEADWLPRLQLLQKLLEGMDLSLLPAVEGMSTQPSQELDVKGVEVATVSDCHQDTVHVASDHEHHQTGDGVSRDEAEDGECDVVKTSHTADDIDAEASEHRGRVQISEVTVGKGYSCSEQREEDGNASQQCERKGVKSVMITESKAECRGTDVALTDHDLRYMLADSTQKHPEHLSHTIKIKGDINKKDLHTGSDAGGHTLQSERSAVDSIGLTKAIGSGEEKASLKGINLAQCGPPPACQSLPDIPQSSKEPCSDASNMNIPPSETQTGGHNHFKTPSTSGRSNTRYASVTSAAKRMSCRCGHQPQSNVALNSTGQSPDQTVDQVSKTAHELHFRGGGSGPQDRALGEGSTQSTGCPHLHSNTLRNHTPHGTTPAHQPNSSPLSSVGTSHPCIACHPRLKCPLITSRNFLKILRDDKFTCAYHHRLVSRLICRQNNRDRKRGTSIGDIQDGGVITLRREEQKVPKRNSDGIIRDHNCRSTGHHLLVMQDSLMSHTPSSRQFTSGSAVSDSSDMTYTPSSEQSTDSMELSTPPDHPPATGLDGIYAKAQSTGEDVRSEGGCVLVEVSTTRGSSRTSATLSGIGSVRRAQRQRPDKNQSSAMVYPTPQLPPPQSVKCHSHDQPLLPVRPHSMLAAVLGMCGESSVNSARPEAALHKYHHMCSDMMGHSAEPTAGKTAKVSDRLISGKQHHSQRNAVRLYQLTHCRPKAVAAVEGGRPPLRERGNTLRRERSEYDYRCTPVKTEFGRGRNIQPLYTLQPASHEDTRRPRRDKEDSSRASVKEV